VKTTIIALSVTALISAAPAVLAQGASSKSAGLQHKVSKKHPPAVSGHAPRSGMQANGWKRTYPGAFGYAPSEPRDYLTEMSRQAGGGGGGGGGM
jgi:hypothetical protein